MLNLAQGDFGFIASFKVTFDQVPSGTGPFGIPLPPVPFLTLVPVTSDFFQAEITVDMDATEASNGFTMTIDGMGEDIYDSLVPQQTVVHITLGYSDADSKEVMTGLLTEKNLVAGDQWYKATLKGIDFVFTRLQRPPQMFSGEYKGQTVKSIAADVCKQAGVDTIIPAAGKTLPTITFSQVTHFDALRTLAKTSGFRLQAKDGKLWMGTPDALGITQTTPVDDGATSRPVVARGATPAASPLEGQDFSIAGLPALRPCDLVTLGKKTYRVQSVTHKFCSESGYTCTGRALSPDASDDDAQKAGRPSASLVAKQLTDNLDARDRKRPAVDVGDVKSYSVGVHTTTLNLGFSATPDLPSASVQATPANKLVALNDKPIASAFAFDNCGLVVPVYPGMRSVLVHGWNEPEDAIVGGFVWTSTMTPPANQAGDWWLCLPTQIGGDGKPSGPGVDDLITGDGHRVIQVKGLKITIGPGLLGAVGTRPTPGPDGVLTIQSDDNKTVVTVKAGQVEVTDGTSKLTVGGGQVVMSDGQVTLTLGSGKVSIS